jgi:hypothetical protein
LKDVKENIKKNYFSLNMTNIRNKAVYEKKAIKLENWIIFQVYTNVLLLTHNYNLHLPDKQN